MADLLSLPLEARKEPALRRLRVDGDTQSRARIDEDTIAELADWLERNKGKELEPVVVFRFPTSSCYWLVHGFHRHEAYVRAGRSHIPCVVKTGTLRDARIYSASCNQRPELKRSNADKRRAVTMILDEIEAAPEQLHQGVPWNNCRIAAWCGVDEGTVRNIKRERAEKETEEIEDALGNSEIETDEVAEPESDLDPDDAPKLDGQCRRSTDKLLRQATHRAALLGEARPAVLASYLAERMEGPAELRALADALLVRAVQMQTEEG